ARRLAVLLGRHQARAAGRQRLAAVAPPRAAAQGRGVREALGRAGDLHRPLLRTVARVRAAGRRHFQNALLALPSCQRPLGLCGTCRVPTSARPSCGPECCSRWATWWRRSFPGCGGSEQRIAGALIAIRCFTPASFAAPTPRCWNNRRSTPTARDRAPAPPT